MIFVWKSTHDLEVRALKEKLILSQSLCDFQERVYLSQIEDLKRLVFLPKSEPSKEVYEADAVLSGSEKPFEQSEAERNAYLEGARELDLLVSGNYTEDLLS